MTFSPDLRQRLRRLGVQQGAKNLPPTAPKPAPTNLTPLTLESIPNGREEKNQLGTFFVIQNNYPLEQAHGIRTLGDWLNGDPATIARLTNTPITDLSQFAFFDIETTGLAGGAGTLAFLIGVGTTEDDQYVLRQFFLRQPAEEAALLYALKEVLQDRVALVTYNGRGFDVPIVETRYVLKRQRFALRAMPNLDLLPFARRLWRGQYENCSLSTLERRVLNNERTAEDVPGMFIPQMYVDFLRSGDAREMHRVIYHNAQDILAMTALAAHMSEIFANPLTPKRKGDEVLRMALWHDDAARPKEAEEMYRAALQRPLTDELAVVLYQRYGALLKKQNRRAEAVALWQAWADLDATNPEPCLEIAKYFEWEMKDLTPAKEWAARALMCLSHWRKDWRREEMWNQIKHRLERLKRK